MTLTETMRRKRVLEPSDRISEVLFGIIMAMTFTGTLGATTAHDDIHAALIGAIGCNIAWGIVDAAMYVIGSLVERGRNIDLLRQVRSAPDAQTARGLIADSLPFSFGLGPAAVEHVWQRVRSLPEPPPHAQPERADFVGALGVFLLVVISTFPVVVPFMVLDDADFARRVSNGVAVVIMFVGGYGLGLYGGFRPFVTGLVMAALGAVLTLTAIALGG